jgi:hypothetical protein
MLPEQSRRELFVGVLRYGALAGVATAGALALVKRRCLSREGVCINNGMCQGCGVLADCGLPQALQTKDTLKKGEHGRSK